MARNCNCAGSTCGCKIIAGEGIQVTGSGTEANPVIVSNKGVAIKKAIAVADSATLILTLTGEGTEAEPVVISGEVNISFGDLTGNSALPQAGQVPVWVITNGVGAWKYQAPPTTPPGAVTVGAGLVGDGSGATPLRARTTGTFGTGALAGFGSDTGAGAPIYTDAAGGLRTIPQGALPHFTSATRPTARQGLLIYDDDLQAVLLGQGTGYEIISSATPVGSLMQFAGEMLPAGWLACNGATYAKTEFPLLATTLGTRGVVANDPTRFRVPDMRGRVGVGQDINQVEFNQIGKQGGAKTHTLTVAEMPAHTHQDPTSTGQPATATKKYEVPNPQYGSYDYGTPSAPTSSTGGGLPHNNLQPYETVLYLIRAL